jgi:hypothetical protein
MGRFGGLVGSVVRAGAPVGSDRRNRMLGVARRAGLLPPATPTAYERWVSAVGPGLASPLAISATERTHHLRVQLVADAAVTPSMITNTLVSLANQDDSNWTASEPLASAFDHNRTRQTFRISALAEPRIGMNPPVNRTLVHLNLRLGDSLDAAACRLILDAAQLGATTITAEFDVVDAVTGRRTAPAAIGPWEPDLADQFDLSMGLTAEVSALGTAVGAGNDFPHVRSHLNVLLAHRRLTERERRSGVLPPRQHGASTLTALSGYSFGGTRVHHPVQSGLRAAVIVRDPVTNPQLAATQERNLLAAAGSRVGIERVVGWHSGSALPELQGVDIVAIVDGGLTPDDGSWLDDLSGVLLREHIFAVSPLVTVPSGIVFDAGISNRPTGPQVRSGRVDLAPFELARCRKVDTVSGRAVVMRAVDAATIDWSQHVSARIGDAAGASGRSCLIWAHQRWALDIGLEEFLPTDSPMLAWGRGRLGTWLDDGIAPHQPEPGRIGEGVW